MRALGLILIFVGAILITKGVYQSKPPCPAQHMAIKFVPRTLYDEQLAAPS